jgi:hypothetical protein
VSIRPGWVSPTMQRQPVPVALHEIVTPPDPPPEPPVPAPPPPAHPSTDEEPGGAPCWSQLQTTSTNAATTFTTIPERTHRARPATIAASIGFRKRAATHFFAGDRASKKV